MLLRYETVLRVANIESNIKIIDKFVQCDYRHHSRAVSAIVGNECD
jgi:hypothetical protein